MSAVYTSRAQHTHTQKTQPPHPQTTNRTQPISLQDIAQWHVSAEVRLIMSRAADIFVVPVAAVAAITAVRTLDALAAAALAPVPH